MSRCRADIAIILSLFSFTMGYQYKATLQNEQVFDECNLPHYKNLDSLFDLSQLSFSLETDVIIVSGIATLRWPITKKDRIEVLLQ